ncbi:MAG: PHP domain-containing protein, partial [Planctomycetes bacterium]|nr:PHP domain-containing protein [Planctomycetota bacterium]
MTLLLLAGCLAPSSNPDKDWRTFEFKVFHLGTPGKPEWLEFAQDPPQGRDLSLPFPSPANEIEHTLLLWQNNVKLGWTLAVNGKKIGQLPTYEFPVISAFALPPGSLKAGENLLSLAAPREVDDILVGMIRIEPRPLSQVVGESTLDIDVVEPIAGSVPCRITIVDDALGALPPLAAKPLQRLAVRPGCVYTTDGRARITLPAGRYRIHAGRGFEYSVATERVTVAAGATRKVSLKIHREVPTANLAACDTHVHTLHFSGHGDATDDERAITLAGEGIELPVATEHNQANGYAEAAVRMGVRDRFTPVLGSEITTKKGHFNIFPVDPKGPLADWTLTDWPKLMASIRATPGVRVAVFNHPRNRHDSFVPFADENFNPVTGENRRGFEFSFDAMELLNSSALRNDDTEVIHDWMALLNYGYRITGVGSSDCHDVNRYIVGQGRTYVVCKDADPSKIDVAEACDSLLKGRALVSLGLLTQIKVNGRFGVGDLVTGSEPELDVEVRVFGPSWTRVERVELYANGERIRDEWPDGGAAGGEKVRLRWKIGRPKNDVHLVAVASWPGVRELYWPLSRPYQSSSPVWNPRVFGITNPVWVDADGDGV